MNRTLFLAFLIGANIALLYYSKVQKTNLLEYNEALVQDLDRKREIIQRLLAVIEIGCKRLQKFKVWSELMHEISPIAYGTNQTVDSMLVFIHRTNDRTIISPKFIIPHLDSFPVLSQKIILIESVYQQILRNIDQENNFWRQSKGHMTMVEEYVSKGDSIKLSFQTGIIPYTLEDIVQSGINFAFLKNKKEILPKHYPLHYSGDPKEIAFKIINPITEEAKTYRYEK